MKSDMPGQEFGVSQTIYGYLLRAYPPRHRAQYGAAMAQLFRDQCRDAWNESQTLGLCKLWLRVLPDLACTSILERLAALRERKTMTEKIASLFVFRSTPAAIFLAVFAVVFLVVLTISVAITFILPESYASTARIKVESDAPTANGQPPAYDPYFIQTTFEIMQSQLVLSNVVARLNLNVEWGKKYFNGQTLKTTETMEILKPRMQLAPIKNTKLIAITVYSDDKHEAAQIANAIAESYRDYRQATRAALAAKGLQVLEDNCFAQERLIEKSQAEVEALQKKFGILDDVQVQVIGAITADTGGTSQQKSDLLARLRSLSKEERRNVLPVVVADPDLSDLLGKLHVAEQNFAAKTNEYALTSIEVWQVKSLLDNLNHQIDDRVAGIMAGLEAQLAASKMNSDNLAASGSEIKAQPGKPTVLGGKTEPGKLGRGPQITNGKNRG